LLNRCRTSACLIRSPTGHPHRFSDRMTQGGCFVSPGRLHRPRASRQRALFSKQISLYRLICCAVTPY
jgi:predicted phosphodiesterase